MATYYFRNTGNTSWAVASNWSLTDGGGATGAIPTATDNAYFSNLSGNCSVNTTSTCLNIDFSKGTGYTGNLSFSSSSLTIPTGGSIILSPSMTSSFSSTGGFSITNCSLNFNGNSLGRVSFIGNSTVTLLSDIRIGTLITQFGTFTITFSGNYNIYVDTITPSGTSQVWNLSGGLNVKTSISFPSSSSSGRCHVRSSLAGTKRNIIIGNEASQDLSFVSFTDISAIGGQTIFTYKGVITNCDNVQQLTQAISQISKGEIM